MRERKHEWPGQSGAGRILIFAGLLTLGSIAFFCLAGTRSAQDEPIDKTAYTQLMGTRIRSFDALLDWFNQQQAQFTPVIPPGTDDFPQPGEPGLVVVELSATSWPRPLLESLRKLAPVWRNSVPTWEIELQEEPTGEVVVWDLSGNLLYVQPAPAGYPVPYNALFRQSLNPLVWNPALAPYRLRARVILLPQEQVEYYLYADAEIAKAQSAGDGGGMMLMGVEEELKVVGMGRSGSGLRLDVGYPESYSGHVWSVYSYDAPACWSTNMSGSGGGPPPPPGTNDPPCTNCPAPCNGNSSNTFDGLNRVWTLVQSNLVLTGTTQTAWTDTRPMGFDMATNSVNRFYSFARSLQDTDGDLLDDAFEWLALHTLADNADTDGDGMDDGWEHANGLNPTDNGSGNSMNGASGDPDSDGLSNAEEFELGTNPQTWTKVVALGMWDWFGATMESRPWNVLHTKHGFRGFQSERRYLRSDRAAHEVDAIWAVGGSPGHCNPAGYFHTEDHAQADWYATSITTNTFGEGRDEYSETTGAGSCCLKDVYTYSLNCGGVVGTGTFTDTCGEGHVYTNTTSYGGVGPAGFGTTVSDTQTIYASYISNNLPEDRIRVERWSLTNTLSQEFTTQRLMDEAWDLYAATSAVPTLPWDVYFVGACFELQEDEFSLDLSGYKYRWRIPDTEPGTVYAAAWAHSYFDESGAPGAVQSVHSILVAGTGGEILVGVDDGLGSYRPHVGGGGSFVLDPPDSNGCNHIYGLAVEMTSQKAANSPKTFRVGKTDPPAPCGKSPEQVDALTIYYNEVFNYQTKQLEDVDVTLQAGTIFADLGEVEWTRAGGPSSGTLVPGANGEATFSNPTNGGLYQFDATIAETTTRAQMLLPLGGPDVTDYIDSEFQRYSQWITDLNNALSNKLFGTRWFHLHRNLVRTVAGQLYKTNSYILDDAPCGSFCPHTVTIHQHVFGADQMGNFMFGFVVGRSEFSFAYAWSGGQFAQLVAGVRQLKLTPDHPEDQAAYTAGYQYGKNMAYGFASYLTATGSVSPYVASYTNMQLDASKHAWPSTSRWPEPLWVTYPVFTPQTKEED